jgi:hypothetical protein
MESNGERNVNNHSGVYKEAFPAGSSVRIADRAFLEIFKNEWKYHHKLQPEQLQYADRIAVVKGVGFYHGGDPVYQLVGVPGLWLEPCLRPDDVSE